MNSLFATYQEEQKPLDMIDFSPAGSGSHYSMMNVWERLPAASETNPSDVGYFVNALVTASSNVDIATPAFSSR